MLSYDFPYNQTSCVDKNYTIASTLKKSKSFSFELLFGDYVEKRIKTSSEQNIIDPIDYVFKPGQVFAFGIKSYGSELKKIHQYFVLQACKPNQQGAIIPGITPGAEILLSTSGTTTTIRLKAILDKLRQGGVNLTYLSPDIYRRLHQLIDAKINADYFVSELLANNRD